ncbi:uncharacterized protein A4U43_C07F1090 [Asparagus officinalis]|uniref:Uncharacterized protein n=1 Tax=Asparagus officinalis TaxID=4686 RepID=A0A5P1E8J6_ASPOF|nr:uncharacterized protein A4U43_C07F1090 [Asparagus officinalis]
MGLRGAGSDMWKLEGGRRVRECGGCGEAGEGRERALWDGDAACGEGGRQRVRVGGAGGRRRCAWRREVASGEGGGAVREGAKATDTDKGGRGGRISQNPRFQELLEENAMGIRREESEKTKITAD